jgi:protein phosphatase
MPTSPPRKPLNDELDVFGLTHPGNVRKNNEDQFLIASINKQVQVMSTSLSDAERVQLRDDRLALLAMVADGVGGLDAGEEASATALEATMRYVTETIDCYYRGQTTDAQLTDDLRAAAMRAHDAITAKRVGEGRRGRMATTLTMYVGLWPTYYLVQVGDSRHYVLYQGTLRQLSRDQTIAQELLDRGVLSREDAARSPYNNVLSSALGGDNTEPVITRLDSAWGMVHLLCSDGLTKHVTDEQIHEVLTSMTSSQQAAERLLALALEGGGTDNVTIIVGRAVPKPGRDVAQSPGAAT